MKTKQEILQDFGCSEIPFDENVTMYYPAILSAMEEHAKEVSVEFFLWYFKEYKVDTSKEMSIEDLFDLFAKEKGL